MKNLFKNLRKLSLLLLGVGLLLLNNELFSQSINLSTDTLDVFFTQCDDSVTKSFDINNVGSKNLTYNISYFADSRNISTTFAGGNNSNGNMFDIAAKEDVRLDSFEINCTSISLVKVAVYYKLGSYAGYEEDSTAWTFLGIKTIQGNGEGIPSKLPLGNIVIYKGQTVSIYITTVDGSELSYTDGANTYTNNNLSITTGVGKLYPFMDTYSPRTWNGTVYYSVSGQKNLSSATGEILSMGTKKIDVKFYSKGLKNGNFSNNINITSNDTLNSHIAINCNILVQGKQKMVVQNSHNYGSVFQYAVKTDTLKIYNTGCDTLKINEITSSTSDFVVDTTYSRFIVPGGNADLLVSFAPKSLGLKNAKITIKNNDIDTIIMVSGTGIVPPQLSLSTKSISASVTECSGSANNTLKISNTGANNLTFAIANNFIDSCEDNSKKWVTEAYNSQDLWHLSGLNKHEGKMSWWCGIEKQGNFDNGQRINNALISPEIDLTSTVAPILSFWENYDTEPDYDGCAIEISTNNGTSWETIRGANTGTSNGWVNTEIDLKPYCGHKVKIKFHFDTEDGISNDYPGWFIDNIIIKNYAEWVTFSKSSGTISSGANTNLNVVFNASGLVEGNYKTNILVASNDPLNPIDTIACSFSVKGNPNISASDTLKFDDVINHDSDIKKLTIQNNGCDTLIVTDINSSVSEFYVTDTSFIVVPFSSTDVNVTFAPNSIGLYNGKLTILNNDKTITVNVVGNSILPTIIGISTDKPDGYYRVGESILFTTEFNCAVNVNSTNGTPRIKMNSSPMAYANYSAGSGSTKLTFNYVVDNNHNTTNLDYTSINDLTLEGGTIIDNFGNEAVLTLPEVGILSKSHKIVIDNVAPKVLIASAIADTSGRSPMDITVHFNEAISGFALSDLVVANGVASNLQLIDDSTFTASVAPDTNGIVTVNIAAASVTDLAGNNNIEAPQFSRVYDNSIPSLKIYSTSAPVTKDNPVFVVVESNVVVKGFAQSDITATNGTISDFNVVPIGTSTDYAGVISKPTWTFNLTPKFILPVKDGEVKLLIPAGAVESETGVLNPESTEFSVTYDVTAPTVSITSDSNNPTQDSTITIKIVFSEIVSGFTLGDIEVKKAQISNLQNIVSGTTWTADLVLSADSIVTVNVADSSVVDIVGNYNLAAPQFSILYDTIQPQIKSLNINNVMSNSVTAVVKCNKNGRVYYILLQLGAAVPSANEIIEGKVNSGATIAANGDVTVKKDVNTAFDINDLVKSTDYSLYTVCVDAYDSISNVMKADFSTLSAGVSENETPVFVAYPNPNKGVFYLTSKTDYKNAIVTVLDLRGIVVKSLKINDLVQKIDLSNAPKGMYLIYIQSNTFNKAYSVVVQ